MFFRDYTVADFVKKSHNRASSVGNSASFNQMKVESVNRKIGAGKKMYSCRKTNTSALKIHETLQQEMKMKPNKKERLKEIVPECKGICNVQSANSSEQQMAALEDPVEQMVNPVKTEPLESCQFVKSERHETSVTKNCCGEISHSFENLVKRIKQEPIEMQAFETGVTEILPTETVASLFALIKSETRELEESIPIDQGNAETTDETSVSSRESTICTELQNRQDQQTNSQETNAVCPLDKNENKVDTSSSGQEDPIPMDKSENSSGELSSIGSENCQHQQTASQEDPSSVRPIIKNEMKDEMSCEVQEGSPPMDTTEDSRNQQPSFHADVGSDVPLVKNEIKEERCSIVREGQTPLQLDTCEDASHEHISKMDSQKCHGQQTTSYENVDSVGPLIKNEISDERTCEVQEGPMPVDTNEAFSEELQMNIDSQNFQDQQTTSQEAVGTISLTRNDIKEERCLQVQGSVTSSGITCVSSEQFQSAQKTSEVVVGPGVVATGAEVKEDRVQDSTVVDNATEETGSCASAEHLDNSIKDEQKTSLEPECTHDKASCTDIVIKSEPCESQSAPGPQLEPISPDMLMDQSNSDDNEEAESGESMVTHFQDEPCNVIESDQCGSQSCTGPQFESIPPDVPMDQSNSDDIEAEPEDHTESQRDGSVSSTPLQEDENMDRQSPIPGVNGSRNENTDQQSSFPDGCHSKNCVYETTDDLLPQIKPVKVVLSRLNVLEISGRNQEVRSLHNLTGIGNGPTALENQNDTEVQLVQVENDDLPEFSKKDTLNCKTDHKSRGTRRSAVKNTVKESAVKVKESADKVSESAVKKKVKEPQNINTSCRKGNSLKQENQVPNKNNLKVCVKKINKKNEKNTTVCKLCLKSYSNKAYLKTHMKVAHTDDKPYSCNICSKSFAMKCFLTQHTKNHAAVKPYKCNVCLKGFVSKSSHDIHMRIHTGANPYTCSVCHMTFAVQRSYVEHMKSHSGKKPFECSECKKGYTTKSDLVCHMRIHSGEKPYACTTCSYSTTCSSALKSHMRTHTGEKPYQCDVCSKSFSCSSSLTGHMRIHTGERPHKCSMCSQAFKARPHLVRHIRKHTGEKPYKCIMCSKSFGQSSNLKAHIARMHDEMADCSKKNIRKFPNSDNKKVYFDPNLRIGKETNSDFHQKVITGKNVGEKQGEGISFKIVDGKACHLKDSTGKIDCGKEDAHDVNHKIVHDTGNLGQVSVINQEEQACLNEPHLNGNRKLNQCNAGKQTSQKQNSRKLKGCLKKNKKDNKNNNVCELCLKSFLNKAKLKSHMNMCHTDYKPYTCSTCSKSFSLKWILNQHLKNHAAVKPYKCNVCSKEFAVKNTLDVHMREHTGKKLYSCNTCSYSTMSSSAFKIHVRVHNGEKPFSCNVCHRKFACKSNFVSHMKRHTGEKRFQCTVCKKGFYTRTGLVQHVRIHTGEKPYACNKCSYSSALSTGLKRHMSVHSCEKPYKCTVCSQSVKSAYYLKIHMRIHTGERPYKCSICSHACRTKSCLNKHMRKHRVEQIYKCGTCSKSFSRSNDLKAHISKINHEITDNSKNADQELPHVNDSVMRDTSGMNQMNGETGQVPKQNLAKRSTVKKNSTKRHVNSAERGKKEKDDCLCKLCSKSFKKGSFIEHVKTAHSHVKTYPCKTCDEYFLRVKDLSIHVYKVHRGLTPLPCTECRRVFLRKSKLADHMKTHTDEKTYTCDVCQKKFSSKPNLASHSKIHSGVKPFECKVCQKTFLFNHKLVKHMRTHTGEKPYACNECSFTSGHLSSLREHMKTHRCEKPFPCSLCSKSFKHRIALQRHIKSIHRVRTNGSYFENMQQKTFTTKVVLRRLDLGKIDHSTRPLGNENLNRVIANTEYIMCVLCSMLLKKERYNDHITRKHSK